MNASRLLNSAPSVHHVLYHLRHAFFCRTIASSMRVLAEEEKPAVHQIKRKGRDSKITFSTPRPHSSTHNTRNSSMAASPIPKKEKRSKLPSRPHDPTVGYRPYPTIPDLPNSPRTEDEELVKDKGGLQDSNRSTSPTIFTGIEESNNYVDHIKRLLSTEIELVRSPHFSNFPFTVVLKLPIPPEYRHESYPSVEYVIGMGCSLKARMALNLAKRDLAERLYQVLKNGMDFLSSDTKKRLGLNHGIQYATVTLSNSLRENLQSTCQFLNKTNIFYSSAPDTDEYEDDEIRKSFGKVSTSNKLLQTNLFKSLSTALIDKTPLPQPLNNLLPIIKSFHRIIHCIEHNNVTILSAATGSGKTTQLPQFILDYYAHHRSHFDRPPSILVTQPRRIAAKSVAERVAMERDSMAAERGGARAVGYSVRFENRWPTDTSYGSILFCTAGILLRKLQKEPDLRSITHLILDEVHERDVFTDIALLVARDLLGRRPDLRLVLMSATMESEKLVNYFRARGLRVGTVLEVEGTNYPIAKYYLEDILKLLSQHGSRPKNFSPETTAYIQAELQSKENEHTLSTAKLSKNNNNMDPELIINNPQLEELPLDLMAELIRNLTLHKPPGAILVFLPGWEEITELHQLLVGSGHLPPCEYHLLHSTAPVGTAEAAFRVPSPGTRKIILATNLAESSITIPDVVYVVDGGRQKVMHYDQRLRMNVLEPCWISQANLRQRQGRAGRCQPGEYYGLMKRQRADHELPEQTLPELKRLGLDEVVLSLKAMGLTQAPAASILAMALDAPERTAITTAVQRLKRLGALNDDERLTPLGRLLSTLPIHPAMGKMAITASILGCLSPILTTVGLLGQKIIRPTRLPTEKYHLHALYQQLDPHGDSDHLMMHRLFMEWKANRMALPASLQSFEALLSRPALRRLDESRYQIYRELKNNFAPLPELSQLERNAEMEGLVRLVLASGFYPEVAWSREKRNLFRLPQVSQASLVPSSVAYVLGPGVVGAWLDEQRLGRDPRKLVERTIPATCYVYEELLDVGQKLVSKVTAIDPLALILFAHHPEWKQFRPIANRAIREDHSSTTEGTIPLLVLDDFVYLRNGTSATTDGGDLRLVLELRAHWNDFVQFYITKRLAGLPFSSSEQEAIDRFVGLMIQFTKELDVARPLVKVAWEAINSQRRWR